MRRVAALITIPVSLFLACQEGGDSVRPAQGDPNDPASPVDRDAAVGRDAGETGFETPTTRPGIPSACKRMTPETLVSVGGGSTFTFTWDRDRYVMVYASIANKDIAFVATDRSGVPLAVPKTIEATPGISQLPVIVPDDRGYIIAWDDDEGGGNHVLYARRVQRDGATIGPATRVRSISTAGEVRPVLARAHGATMLAWMERVNGIDGAFVGKLDENLNLLAANPQRLGGPAATSFPWIAGDDGDMGVVWSDARGGTRDVFFAKLNPSLEPSGELRIRTGAGEGFLARMIRTNFGYLAAWEDDRSGLNEIFMSMLDTSGAPIADGLVPEPNSGDANWPNMAWNGSAAAVAYYQFRAGVPQVFVTFVDGRGVRVGNKGDVQVSETTPGHSAKYPEIRWNGESFGIGWIDTRSGGPEVYFARLACTQ
jgi:hypothetical protein